MNSFEKIKSVLEKHGAGFSLDQPEEVNHGDYATNIAFIIAKAGKKSPKSCAEELIPKLQKNLSDVVEKIEIAGAGFINFFLNNDTRKKEIENIAKRLQKLNILSGKTVVCEYTDPNPFKLFHIGHLVSNAVGESLSRIYEYVGANIVRVCYQGDVGMHVATTIWGVEHMHKDLPKDTASLKEKVAFLGEGYAYGTNELARNPNIKGELEEINKHLFEGKEHELYEKGKKWSLDYFDSLCKKLGTQFDHLIFESEVAGIGKKIVEENTPKVFEKSDGAYVYKGEKVGLHTRVFINSQGFPTYEAKELGNCFRKDELIPNHDLSIIITANEINEYFKVIKAVLKEISPNYAEKLNHISHGMLRLPEGKMSSRTGNIISAEDLIDDIKSRLKDRLDKENGDEKLGDDIAIGAIKFSILKQAIGRDIIFEIDKSISFEGDSGPYLQYTYARIVQLLKKAEEKNIKSSYVDGAHEAQIERKLLIFQNIVQKSYLENSPHHLINYLIYLTHEFNSLYGRQIIVDEKNEKSSHYVLLSEAVRNILKDGLYMLGIVSPEKM